MSNEATIQVSLRVDKGHLHYQNTPTSFKADVSEAKGPTPGLVVVPTTGINVSFALLTDPGLCWIYNLDDTNYVRWGVHDGSIFHPVGRILPGEGYIIRLDDSLGEEEAATGTGTTAPVNSLYLKAVGGTCNVRVEALEA